MNNIVMLEENTIDLSLVSAPADILLELNNILEKNSLENRKIKLILGSIALTPAHVCGIKSILESSGVEIDLIYTNSVHTQLAALGAGLAVAEVSSEAEKKVEENFEEPVIEEAESKEQEIEDQYTTERALEEALNKELISKENTVKTDNRTKTLYIRQTLRSGQTISFDGNVVVIGDCHSGSEIVASGDITVWGILNGIAHAGAQGDYKACIRALRINAIQLRIADFFARRPDKLEVEKVERSNTFTPEEARISDGEIIIYALNA